MKKALVLAGGFPQIELIKKLKSRGYYVILADYSVNPVAKQYADKYYKESTLNEEKIKEIAIEEKVEFIITVCTDQALLTVAKVSEELGLPCYIDYKTALNVTNKQYMKEVFVKNNIPTAKHIILEYMDLTKLNGFKYPLIVKPVDCNSSKGVKKVNNESELVSAFNEAKELSRTKTAIIEEFIQGPELTVDAYIDNGKAIILSISNNEKIKDDDKFVIFRTINPAKPNLEDKIQVVVQKIADAFKLKNTTMLIQMLAQGEDVYVIEFSARTGGGVKHLLIKNLTEVDVIDIIIDLTEGKIPQVIPKKRKFKYLVNNFIYCMEGQFDHLEGFEKLKADGVILDYYLFKHKGTQFYKITCSGNRVAGYTIVGDFVEEVKYKNTITNNLFKVIGSNGEDMARHDILEELDI